MSSVLRIALTYFAFVPLQKWLNGIAAVLLAVGTFLVFGMTESNARQGASIFVMLTVILIGITPLFGGGIAMRFASTRSLLHLRPQGRLRLLLGSTIAITVLALLATLAVWYLSMDNSGAPGRPPAPARIVFQISWSAIAATWMLMFALSRSMLVFALMGLLPVIGNHLLRMLLRVLPDPLWILALAVAAWVAFCIWYLRTDSVQRPNLPAFSMSSTGFEGSPIQRVLVTMGGSKGERTKSQVAYEYLFGCASPLFFVIVGAWVGFLFVLVNSLSVGARIKGAGPLIAMLPFFCFFHASLGYTTARRARFLWLRAGLDRTALFRLSEWWGQRSAFSAWGVTAACVIVYALVRGTELTAPHLLYIAAQGLMGVALFYAGLGSVRGWTVDEVIVAIAVAVLFVVQGFVLAPFRDIESSTYLAGIALAALIAALLRWRAIHMWRTLDWRTATLSRLGMWG